VEALPVLVDVVEVIISGRPRSPAQICFLTLPVGYDSRRRLEGAFCVTGVAASMGMMAWRLGVLQAKTLEIRKELWLASVMR
jgi:hypothetical protein